LNQEFEVRNKSYVGVCGCERGINLLCCFQIPTVSVNAGNGKALNKLEWDKSGKKVAIGSSDGEILIYDIGEVKFPSNLSRRWGFPLTKEF
jgi:WD40 repeat protein